MESLGPSGRYRPEDLAGIQDPTRPMRGVYAQRLRWLMEAKIALEPPRITGATDISSADRLEDEGDHDAATIRHLARNRCWSPSSCQRCMELSPGTARVWATFSSLSARAIGRIANSVDIALCVVALPAIFSRYSAVSAYYEGRWITPLQWTVFGISGFVVQSAFSGRMFEWLYAAIFALTRTPEGTAARQELNAVRDIAWGDLSEATSDDLVQLLPKAYLFNRHMQIADELLKRRDHHSMAFRQRFGTSDARTIRDLLRKLTGTD